MRFLALALALTGFAQATSARDVLTWDAIVKWNRFAASATKWSKQFDPYAISVNNRKLVHQLDSEYYEWRKVMRQLGDL